MFDNPFSALDAQYAPLICTTDSMFAKQKDVGNSALNYDLSILDFEELSALSKRRKHALVGSSHPGLHL